ncbi:MAG: hypothetical protein ACPGVY_14910 [Mycobacterium sp.]
MPLLRQFADRISPGWLRGTWGTRLVQGVFALSADVLSDWAVEGVRAARMLVAHSGPEALEMTGRERLMPRYLDETDTAYAARLQDAWDLWAAAGTAAGMIAQFAAAGWSGVEIYTSTQWPLRHVAGWWSQWFLFFPEGTHSWTGPNTYGDGHTYGDGATYGSSATVGEVQRIRGILGLWKAGHEICREVVIEITGPTYGTGHTYGDGSVYGGAQASFKGTPRVRNEL